MQCKLTFLTKKLALATLIASSTLVTSTSFAQSAGDTVVTAGWFHIVPQDSSTPITVTSPASVAGPVAGSGAAAKNSNTLGFSVTQFLTDNWAVAFDLGVPAKYKLNGTGSLAGVGEIGTAKQWAPAILAKYYFGDANATFRPSVGLGVSRVSYTDIKLSNNFQGAMGAQFQDPTATTSVELSRSWAPVYNVGLSYALDKNWSANFSVSYLKLRTKANLNTQTKTGPVASNSTLKLDPLVTYLSIGYKFK